MPSSESPADRDCKSFVLSEIQSTDAGNLIASGSLIELGNSGVDAPCSVISGLRHDAEPQDGVAAQELPPADRGLRAWTFCLCGFILEMMVWGFGFSYGIFQEHYTSNPPFNKASGVAIAAVGTVSLAIQYGEGFLLSVIMGKYPDYKKTLMWSGLALYFVSLFTSSFATRVWQLILLQGVGVGLGGGCLYMPVIRLLPEWFSERRGLAAGIMFSGTGVGGFVFPFVLNALLQKVGLRWTLRIWALSTSLFSGLALFGMRSRFPVPKFTAGHKRPKLIPPNFDMLNNGIFWSFAFTNLMQGLSYFPVSLYIATFTKLLSNQLTATAVLSTFNIASVVGQVIIGHMCDRFSYPSIILVIAVGSALGAFFLWGFASSAVFLYFFAIIFGGLSGGFSSTWPMAAADMAGTRPEFTVMAFGGISLSKGISAVIGPIVSGILLESGKGIALGGGFGRFGYGAVEIFVGCCALASGVGGLVCAFIRQRMRA